jgi:hypothetical protein
MRILRMPVRCLSCGHTWNAETVTDAHFRIVIASWKALHCPNPACRADWRRLAFVTTPPDDPGA